MESDGTPPPQWPASPSVSPRRRWTPTCVGSWAGCSSAPSRSLSATSHTRRTLSSTASPTARPLLGSSPHGSGRHRVHPYLAPLRHLSPAELLRIGLHPSAASGQNGCRESCILPSSPGPLPRLLALLPWSHRPAPAGSPAGRNYRPGRAGNGAADRIHPG